VIEIERDLVGRVTAETCNGRTVSSRYDAAGRRIRRVTPSGAETRWDYDAAGQPVALQSDGLELRFGYDQAAHETVREMPGGARLVQQWDSVGRLAAQTLSAGAGPFIGQPSTATAERMLQRRSYRYRADGALTSVEDLLSGSRQFGLDSAGRVTGVTGPDWAEQYAYDLVGNITAAAWPAPPPGLAAAWAAADVQGPRLYAGTLISRAGGVRYQHDRQGRVIVRQRVRLSQKPEIWRYEWNADNRLTAVTTPDGIVWRYLYDAMGRRIAKQRFDANGHIAKQTDFAWDGLTLAEQATNVDRIVGPEPGQITTWDYRPGTFTPVSQAERTAWRHAPQDRVDARFYAIVTDLIGAPSELVSPDGDLAGYQQHTLWGTTLWHPDGASTPLRFPGQYHDSETDLHYNHQRYYDPATGSYLTPDPLGLAPAPNPHSYVLNPTTHADPLGLEDPCINWNPNSVKTFGHTFNEHGAGANNLQSLLDRARGTGMPQGQWLDNQAAADFLRTALGDNAEDFGPFGVKLPEGLGQVIMPDGRIVPAPYAYVIPSRGGIIRTAYPTLGES
jgi:RHS repeat-associated protein